ncbi:uncharacterized protein I303_107478 [Kwoniella dejecticola CBS 10117]|uniref:Uncharacterized protein n=1 Tax=Kwoniella dejecticola CBS 10117 TaxID=1296121 RepID=A0A1A5ZZU7_9TREE|nr:uncharacterized protein I303_06883 [Kwoniella dejecticola CBS 10117]OBR83318.1 hypothetical protein I303_06883 [Kwoniella dejecticola CBS 10117]
MSAFLSGGGVECGPSNVLKDVKGRLDKDRSLQHDRLVSVPNVASSSKQPFRAVPSAQPRASVPPQHVQTAQSAFDLASLRQHLSPPPSTQHQRVAPSCSWADAFGAYTQVESNQSQSTATQSSQSNGWGAEFAQSTGASVPHFQKHRTGVSAHPVAPWKRPIHQPSFHHSHHMDQPRILPYLPNERESRPYSAPPDQGQERATDIQKEPLTESQDLLARTAQTFVDELDGPSGLLKDNPKLARSKFVSLLKGLGNGALVVDEGQRAQGEEVGEGARFVGCTAAQNGDSDWATSFTDHQRSAEGEGEDLRGGKGKSVESRHNAYPQSMTNNTLGFAPGVMPSLDRSRYGTPTDDASWDSHFQDQEALVRSTENARKSVHFDPEPPLEKERNGVPNSLGEALRHTTGIPGAGLQWEDRAGDQDMDDFDEFNDLNDLTKIDDFDDQVFMGFNGTMAQAPSVQANGAGHVQNWGQLQEDWEEYSQNHAPARAFKGMGTGDQTQRYLFQSRNPYFGVSEFGSYWEVESPTLKDVLELEAAVQNSPSSHEAWYNLGLKQQENEREESAILALSKTIQLEPNYRPAYLALAVGYTNEGESEAAVTMLDKWITLGEGQLDISGSIKGPSEQWDGKKGRSDLIERLINIARRNPEELDAEVQVALGVLFNATEEYQKAEDCFLSALSVRPDDWLLYNRLGATLANSGRSNEAIQYYHKALELHPNFVRALFNLGISYVNLGQYPLAAQSALDALRLQHSDLSEGYSFAQHHHSSSATSSSHQQGGGSGIRSKGKGVTSDALWNVLRSACVHMNRHDLVRLVELHDLSGFPLSFGDVLGTAIPAEAPAPVQV